MPKRYTEKDKARAVSLALSGLSSGEIERQTGVVASYVRGLKREFLAEQKAAVLDVDAGVSESVETQTVAKEQWKTAVKQKANWYGRGFRLFCVLLVILHACLIA